jgi:hypothetical protein
MPGPQAYNTNLAAEFFVLSALHRLGFDAYLSLGNKKAVDITVVGPAGQTATLDVKGLAGTTDFPVTNVSIREPGHFLVFVSFLKKIANLTVSPEVYVVPAQDLGSLSQWTPSGKWEIVYLKHLRSQRESYRDAWHLVVNHVQGQRPSETGAPATPAETSR